MLPIPPIKLMRPFALLRNGRGVTSGMSAMTGERQSDMIKLKHTMKPIMSQSVFAQGIKKKKKAESGMPTMIHGIRRPCRVNVLSLKVPTIG